jgi:class 3 adenylate cyclase
MKNQDGTAAAGHGTTDKSRVFDKLLDGRLLDEAAGNTLTTELLNALAKLEDASIQQRLLTDLVNNYVTLERKIDSLLKNTLPETVAEEIKFRGTYPPRQFDVTILFTDCAGFTKLAEKISSESLIECLHELFSGMDSRVEKFGGTKIKTIGDAYMAVFGAPLPLSDHAEKAILAALEILDFLQEFNRQLPHPFQIRTGIHSGPVMGGVVGRDRMQFDVFGDHVNIASRFESSGEKGRINISADTFRLVADRFTFEPRGEISLKNKAPMNAYFVLGTKNSLPRT